MAKLFIAGDVLNTLAEGYFLDASVTRLVQEADYSVCNFEAPIPSNAKPVEKAGPVKTQKSSTINVLKEAGFNLLLLGNNHIWDYGTIGLQSTLKAIHEQSLHSAGAGLTFDEAYTPLKITINGLKFGLINAGEAQFGQIVDEEAQEGGYAWINHPRINELVKELKKEVDVLIFFAHAGLEHYEVPLPVWRKRYHELCDLGADCIIAAHPHIPQGYEIYKGKPVFYSLGNFYFPRENQPGPAYGIALMLNIKAPGNIQFEIIHTKLSGLKLTNIAENDSPVSLKRLNSLLDPDHYHQLARETCLHAYNNICLKYYHSVFRSINKKDNVLKAAKKLLMQVLFRGKLAKSQELLLLHLLRNETYQYVTEKALEIITQEKR